MKNIVIGMLAALLSVTAASACDGKDGNKVKTGDKTKTEASK